MLARTAPEISGAVSFLIVVWTFVESAYDSWSKPMTCGAFAVAMRASGLGMMAQALQQKVMPMLRSLLVTVAMVLGIGCHPEKSAGPKTTNAGGHPSMAMMPPDCTEESFLCRHPPR